METKSIPPELGQEWYRESWFNNADVALRSSGSPHSPNGIREVFDAFPTPDVSIPPPNVGPIGNMVVAAPARHAGFDNTANSDEEFKRHVVTMLMQRETDMAAVYHQLRDLNFKVEALSMELIKTKSILYEERRMRGEIMNVMVAKEKSEKEERVRREAEEARRKGEQAWREKEEWKRMQETIASLKQGQHILREHVDRRYNEVQSMRLTESPKVVLLTPREILEKKKKDEEEKTEEEDKNDEVKKNEKDEKKLRDEKMTNSSSPSSGPHTPTFRTKTPSIRGSGILTCFNCHREGHYARDCFDLDLECELCGGTGHSSVNCFPSKRCYNCNKAGHRHYECKEQGTRRCFHCRKVGHLAINCKYAPKQ